MPGNRIQEIRECYQEAAHCVQQAEAQNDRKGKKAVFGAYAALAVIGALLHESDKSLTDSRRLGLSTRKVRGRDQ